MAIRFYKAGELPEKRQLKSLIYGSPGAGKTTLAQTARRPVLIDFDDGVDRGEFGGDHFTLDSWEDAGTPEFERLVSYGDTVIVDTVGKMGMSVVQSIIREDDRLGTRNGDLTLQGYGVLRNRFRVWMAWLIEKRKDVLFLGHQRMRTVKISRKEEIEQCEVDLIGGYRQEIVQDMDLMGRLFASDNGTRVLDFRGTPFQTCKNPLGFDESFRLPGVQTPAYRTYLGDLLEDVKAGINRRAQRIRTESADALAAFRDRVATVETVEDLTAIAREISGDKSLAKSALVERVTVIGEHAKQIGAVYSDGKYVAANDGSADGSDASLGSTESEGLFDEA